MNDIFVCAFQTTSLMLLHCVYTVYCSISLYIYMCVLDMKSFKFGGLSKLLTAVSLNCSHFPCYGPCKLICFKPDRKSGGCVDN